MKTYRIVFEDGESTFVESENVVAAIDKAVERNPEYSIEFVIKVEEIY